MIETDSIPIDALWDRVKIALALAGTPRGTPVRDRLARTAELGYRAVQLDASDPGLRPRELSRSARRDLAAVLRRHELRCSGVDLWIPGKDFADPSRLDYAVSASIAAAEFARELADLTGGRAALATLLPSEEAFQDAGRLRAELAEACLTMDVVLADHAWPAPESPRAGITLGIDPPTMFAGGLDTSLAKAVASLRTPIGQARLADLSGSLRVPVGEGRVELMPYLVALSARSYAEDLVVDLRGLPEPMSTGALLAERFSLAERSEHRS